MSADIVQVSANRLVCTRCKGSAPLALPIEARAMIRVIDQFRRGHGRCAGKVPTAMRTKRSEVPPPIYLGVDPDVDVSVHRFSAPLIQATQSGPIWARLVQSEVTPTAFSFTCSVTNVVLPSRVNLSEHWRPRRDRTFVQRAAMRLIAERVFPKIDLAPPLSVRFTRIAPRLLDAGDNDAASFKAIRDGLCDAAGLDDGPKGGVSWLYASRKTAKGEVAGFLVEVWR